MTLRFQPSKEKKFRIQPSKAQKINITSNGTRQLGGTNRFKII